MNKNARVGSVPGKTFFVGEYVALSGGPALLVATDPRFEMSVRPGPAAVKGLPTGSPASRYLAKYASEFSDLQLEFSDPHEGRGGLGASSAQYALVNALRTGWPTDLGALMRDYRECAWNGEGPAPSGADVVAQLCGGIVVYDGNQFATETLSWTFVDLGMTLFRTGQKIPTHEHLKAVPELLSQEGFLRDATECVRSTIKAFRTGDADGVVRDVRAYAKILCAAGVTCLGTLTLLEELNSQPWALAAKGCGALGADILLVLHARDQFACAREWGATRSLSVCGTVGGQSLAQGLVWDEGKT